MNTGKCVLGLVAIACMGANLCVVAEGNAAIASIFAVVAALAFAGAVS